MRSIQPGEVVTDADVEASVLGRRAAEKSIQDQAKAQADAENLRKAAAAKPKADPDLQQRLMKEQELRELAEKKLREQERISDALADLLILRAVRDIWNSAFSRNKRDSRHDVAEEVIDVVAEEIPAPALPAKTGGTPEPLSKVGKRTSDQPVDSTFARRLPRRDGKGKREF